MKKYAAALALSLPGILLGTMLCNRALAQNQPAQNPPAQSQPAPKGVWLYIGWPNNGEVIARGKPFRVWFGLRNMGVAPKGVKFPNTGHHHLLIDTDLPPADQVIPSDRQHLHFGAGETETMLELPPGKHTLQLLLGDENHMPHNPPVHSKKITITVK